LSFETDLFQQAAGIFYTSAGVYITFQVMTVSGQSTCDKDAVNPIFEGSQEVEDIHSPTAGNFDDFDGRGVLKAQAAREIRSIIGTVRTRKAYKLGFKFSHIEFHFLSTKASNLTII
jgi:hypothetical protein